VDRPVVIDAVVDPEEPPLPPHITFEQARNFARAILQEPGGVGVAAGALREKARESLPRW
jgi:pyruvate dehydrogenase (quinone)